MIITLCGSARFENHWHLWSKLLTLSGHCVFTMGTFPSFNNGNKNWYSKDQKNKLDLVHLTKISHSDGIFVLNVDGYIGDSTLKEIEFAKLSDKYIFVLESRRRGNGVYKQPISTLPELGFIHYTHSDLLGPSGSERSYVISLLEAFKEDQI